MDKKSFTSASEFPVKILPHLGKQIRPIHVQLCLTNRCNLKCSFCSCGKRNKSQELDIIRLKKFLVTASDMGMEAITITGGGEPLLYPHLTDVIGLCGDLQVKIGLVTNGFLLPRLKGLIERFTWIRVSMGNDRDTDLLEKALNQVIHEDTDWAFSYVIGDALNEENISWTVKYANLHNFTHVRVVPDLVSGYNFTIDEITKHVLKARCVNDSKVIYQNRNEFSRGAKDCWISLLKPLIAPDGYIYPCCGVQYAQHTNDRDFPKNMRMGKIEDFEKIIKAQIPFNGSKCKRCYYDNYNKLLGLAKTDYEHEEFV